MVVIDVVYLVMVNKCSSGANVEFLWVGDGWMLFLDLLFAQKWFNTTNAAMNDIFQIIYFPAMYMYVCCQC